MINPTVCVFDPTGAIYALTSGVPTNFNGGTPINDAKQLCVDPASAIGARLGAVGYTDPGAIGVNAAGSAVSFNFGVGFDATGRMLVALGGVPVFWENGLPLTADGRVCLNVSGTPSLSAFDTGFSDGFN